MPGISYDLRRHVLNATTKRVRLVATVFGQSKISNLHMAFTVNHDILWFEIAVHDPLFVQVLNTQQDLHKINSGLFFSHPFHFAQQIKQLPSWAVVHYEDVKVLCLDEFVHFDQKFVICLLIHFFLVQNQYLFVFCRNFKLVHKFCCKKFSCM
jgi:hypothetical protein